MEMWLTGLRVQQKWKWVFIIFGVLYCTLSCFGWLVVWRLSNENYIRVEADPLIGSSSYYQLSKPLLNFYMKKEYIFYLKLAR